MRNVTVALLIERNQLLLQALSKEQYLSTYLYSGAVVPEMQF